MSKQQQKPSTVPFKYIRCVYIYIYIYCFLLNKRALCHLQISKYYVKTAAKQKKNKRWGWGEKAVLKDTEKIVLVKLPYPKKKKIKKTSEGGKEGGGNIERMLSDGII